MTDPSHGRAVTTSAVGGGEDVSRLADAVAAAVLACPGVSRLSGGRYGQVATYLPRRRVTGVQVDQSRIQVHVVGRYGLTVDDIAAQVRASVRLFAGDRPVDVAIDDLDVAGGPPDAGPPALTASSTAAGRTVT